MFFWMGFAGENDLFDIGLKSFCASLACFLPSFGLDLASVAGVFFSGCSMPGFASRSPNGGSSSESKEKEKGNGFLVSVPPVLGSPVTSSLRYLRTLPLPFLVPSLVNGKR